jgi:hypothetical protein
MTKYEAARGSKLKRRMIGVDKLVVAARRNLRKFNKSSETLEKTTREKQT